MYRVPRYIALPTYMNVFQILYVTYHSADEAFLDSEHSDEYIDFTMLFFSVFHHF
jgi:hypothetical protein